MIQPPSHCLSPNELHMTRQHSWTFHSPTKRIYVLIKQVLSQHVRVCVCVYVHVCMVYMCVYECMPVCACEKAKCLHRYIRESIQMSEKLNTFWDPAKLNVVRNVSLTTTYISAPFRMTDFLSSSGAEVCFAAFRLLQLPCEAAWTKSTAVKFASSSPLTKAKRELFVCEAK